MFCKYCGKDLGDTKEDLCTGCVKEYNSAKNEKVEEPAKEPEVIETNTNNSSSNTNNTNTTSSTQTRQRSKLAGGLFGIFLGMFGVHNFYLGYEGKGVAQVLITVLSCFTLSFVSAIWGIIEGILILSGEIDKDGDGNPLRD